ncbi:hypothetical protein Tco_0709926 [Tanacetum coccineum]
MRTRNSNFPNNSNVTIPRCRNKGRAPNLVKPELRTIVEVAPMAERTMEELLRAPIEGYGEAIVLPEINADHFEIKTNLLQLVQANPFHGLENENPHAHINSFKRITSTLRFRNVPNNVIKLMMFPYSLEGAAKTCNIIPNPKGEMKAITTRSVIAYKGPSIPTKPSPKKVVKRETEETTDREQSNFQGSTAQIPPPVIPISIPEPDVPKTFPKTTPIPEPDVPKSLPKLNIPYPSRRNDQKSRDKASNQMEKIFQIIQDLRFNISFADALFLMPRFAPTIRNLLMNREKLLELAKIPLNKNCSAMLLKKLPEKLGDPDKFLIPCDFPRMDLCHALADLDAIINLMPLSIWKKLSLPELTPTRMTLELADQSITHPKGVAETMIVLALETPIEILLHHNPSLNESIASISRGILYDAPIDKAECFDPGGDNDEINAFLAIEVPTYIEEGYYDSEGDVLYLESLLSDDNTHNLSSDVFFDHEPQHIKNESDHDTLITFSPKSDPLHHEFAGELITIPPRIVREHEDYISRMWLLCGNSSSRSPKNFHTIIESLPISTLLIEDSDSNREEIDIFSRPDDSIPPGIESDFDSEEDIIDNLLNDDPIPEYERLTFDMEPDVPMINNVYELNEDGCFDPGAGEINVEVDNSFTFVIQTFLPYLTYPEVSPLLSSTENEDTIFDPGIFAFHFSSQEPVVVKCLMEFALPLVSSLRTNEFGD